jgi:hypothetical protein
MMAVERVGDMTLDELTQIIEGVVDRRLRLQPMRRPKDPRSVTEILASIDRHRITLPPGAKSSLELLREDRDA